MKISPNQRWLIAFGCVSLIGLNLFFWHQSSVGLPATLIYLGLLGWAIGQKFFGTFSASIRFGLGSLLVFTMLALVGSLWVEIRALDRAIFLIFLTVLSFIVLDRSNPPPTDPVAPRDDQRIGWNMTLVALIIFGVTQISLLYWLGVARTGGYVYRYWDLLPTHYWPVFLLGAVSLAVILVGRTSLATKLSCL